MRFFIYEPDDSGLEFSKGLSKIDELAKNWRYSVISAGKNPSIGKILPELLTNAGVENFAFKSRIYSRSGKDLTLLKSAATNLVNIFSKFPGSEELRKKSLVQIENANENDWFNEKYCYAFRA